MSHKNPLACGGKGPCCHIGYAHRHCECCDVVIATYQPYVLPYLAPNYPIYPTYYPTWGTGTVVTTYAVNSGTTTKMLDGGS